METKLAHFHWFSHGGSRRRSSLTPAVMCAAAFMLSSFVLSFFSLGGVGENISSAGVTDATNSQSTASLSFTNYACNLWAFGFPALGPTKQTSSNSYPSPLSSLCLLLRWKMLSSNVMLPNVSCMTPFQQLIIALEVAKNGLPRIIGT